MEPTRSGRALVSTAATRDLRVPYDHHSGQTPTAPRPKAGRLDLLFGEHVVRLCGDLLLARPPLPLRPLRTPDATLGLEQETSAR